MPFTPLRITANNPGPMTLHGTNSYLFLHEKEWVVIDAGPKGDVQHQQAILSATNGLKVKAILLTHGHQDHAGGALELKALTQAPLYGFSPSIYPDLTIDHALKDGDEVFGLQILHTPGHASDHLCFATQNGEVFTGDHVMGWSSSFIPLKDGSLALYLQSLQKLMTYNFKQFLPGHGDAIEAPNTVMRLALTTRLRREEQIFTALTTAPKSLEMLASEVYGSRASGSLRSAILQTIAAHLVKLIEEKKVIEHLDGFLLA